ncbi:MAG: hypothetical protein ACKVI4_13665, partial [Actinomycetales bacterium]
MLVQSVVLHDMKATHIKSTFPCSLGARVTGVDDKTYSSTGEAFSAIVLPMAESTRDKALQSDDVSLCAANRTKSIDTHMTYSYMTSRSYVTGPTSSPRSSPATPPCAMRSNTTPVCPTLFIAACLRLSPRCQKDNLAD